MSRIFGAIALSGLLAASAAAQSAPPPQTTPPPTPPPQTTRPQVPTTPQTTPQPPEIVLHGCIVQATTPGMFLLRSAIDPTKKDDTARIYRLTALIEDPDFTTVLNKQVRVVGIADAKPQPKPTQKISDKDLPTFAVSKFEAIAETCSSQR